MASNLKRRIKQKLPFLYLHLWHRPREARRLRAVGRAWRGQLPPASERQSVVCFTIHKCASTMVNRILGEFSAASALRHVDYEGYFVHRDYPRAGELHPSMHELAFQPRGFFYGPFRAFRPIPGLDQYRVILILRDPRDVLTSHYYSMAFSHVVINRALYESRRMAQSLSVDDYVLEWLPVFKLRYQEYADNLLGRPNVLFLRYEDMIDGFPDWLAKLIAWAGFNAQPDAVARFQREMATASDNEDRQSHRRQGRPGDHRRKLADSTVNRLNHELAGVLEAFGYQQ